MFPTNRRYRQMRKCIRLSRTAVHVGKQRDFTKKDKSHASVDVFRVGLFRCLQFHRQSVLIRLYFSKTYLASRGLVRMFLKKTATSCKTVHTNRRYGQMCIRMQDFTKKDKLHAGGIVFRVGLIRWAKLFNLRPKLVIFVKNKFGV